MSQISGLVVTRIDFLLATDEEDPTIDNHDSCQARSLKNEYNSFRSFD